MDRQAAKNVQIVIYTESYTDTKKKKKKMKKIIIFSPTSTEFDFSGDQPLGGADRALLKLIHTFKDDEVKAYIPLKSNEEYLLEKPDLEIKPFMDIFKDPLECDVLILNRKVWIIPNNIKYKKLVFYSQDMPDTPCYEGIKTTNYFDMFDRVVLLSKFHKEEFLKLYNYPENNIAIIGNAADLQVVNPKHLQKEKDPLTFIYMSTPYRGLVVLMKMWKRIIKKYPKAKLHVYSSMAIYGAPELDEIQFGAMLKGLESMEGVISHGSRPHNEVMTQLKRSYLLLYPNTYPETFCNVLMESRACMTPFITSDLGALKETGGAAGIYIEGSAYSEEYQHKFMSHVADLIENKERYALLQSNCSPIRTWKDFSEDFIKEINGLFEGD